MQLSRRGRASKTKTRGPRLPPNRTQIKMKRLIERVRIEQESTRAESTAGRGSSNELPVQTRQASSPQTRQQVIARTMPANAILHKRQARKMLLPSPPVIVTHLLLIAALQLLAPTITSKHQILGCWAQMHQAKFHQASLSTAAQLPAIQSPSSSLLQQSAGTETQLVRGLANSAQSRLELPCLVDQVNCGEVYYITWTKQANATAATSAAKQSSVLNGGGQQQQVSLASAGSPASGLPWSRVYLYTGANDSAPHKPIGDLVNRATFIMPPEPMSIANKQRQQPPFARLVIEEPRLSDEALYKCDVTYVKGKCPSISLVRVQMMALPERAQIFQVAQPLPPGPTVEPPQQQQQQQQNKRAQWQPLASSQLIGPLNEHDQLRLVCVVSGGRPAPRAVFWRKIDFTGRTINLAPGSLATPSEQTSRSSSPQMSHQQVVEVALNHTLTSADLGARFECHVEHEALESLRPAARIISATTSHNLASNQKLLSARQQQQPDAMLDLHPAHTSINRHDDESLEEGSESSGADTENSLLASSSHHPSAGRGPSPVAPLLDSHVIIDLNVGVQSLDLFLNKLSQNQALLQNGALAAAGAAPTATTTTTVTTTTTTTTTKRADEPSGPLKEGDLIELECIAYNSKPAANITWLNGSDVIGIGANGATSLGELEEAGGGVGSSTRRSIERRLDGASLAWTPGQLSGASGASTARSQRNRRLLQRNHMQLNANGQTYNTHSFLLIKLSRHEHGAQITCQARNGPMREPMTKSIELQVQHAPIVLMEPAAGILVAEYESLAQRHNRENNNNVISSVTGGLLAGASTKTTTTTSQAASEQVQIYCIYSANPLQLVPGTTRWFKDGQPLAITGDSRLTESVTPNGYPMLTIRQVNRHDAGKYDCQLTNSAGTSERLAASEACKLEVNFRPSVQLRIYKTTTSSTVGDQGGGELDLEQALVMPGDEFELACEVLEALPNKIDKFHWFSSTTASGSAGGRAGSLRPFATTEGQRFKLGPLPANFTPSQFACTAINSIGQSEPSNTIELELSHTPGPSFVRPVGSARVRKLILSSSKPALSQHLSPTPVQQHDSRFGVVADETNSDELASSSLGRPLMAGKELMLECATHQLGRPRANLWLWFRNGQTIDDNNNSQAQELLAAGGDAKRDYAMAAHYENPTADLRDNPISDRLQQDLSPSSSSSDRAADRTIGGGQQRRPKPAITRLLASGRYLFIPSIQLAHKGNYSCVAVNRLGSGGTGSSSSSATAAYPSQSGGPGRDSYQLSVALAPSFVQPLAAKTFWPETQTAILVGSPSTTTTSTSSSASEQRHKQLELVCHVQCEPICQVEWYHNNELLDIKNGNNQATNSNNNYFSYHVRQTIMEENEETNTFRSLESRLALEFQDLDLASATNSKHNSNNYNNQQQKLDKRLLLIDRDRLLARRHFLNSSNFTCQSGPNSMGPSVRSTTKLVVQYPPENVLISAPSDKLNLVEGANGPLLSCEASGEPQVQYRWLLLRGAGNNLISSSDLVAARYNVKHFANSTSQQDNSGSATTTGTTNGSFAPMARPNDVEETERSSAGGSIAPAATARQLDTTGERIVELTGPSDGEQVGGTTISTLDLSNISIDRKQSGHYICEASNALGQTRQSVYVNVLYKPTCTTLHMHSLDFTTLTREPRHGSARPTAGGLPPKELALDEASSQEEADGNGPIVVATTKPIGAGKNDEYSMVRETSEDFIGLRRVLVMSPLLSSAAGGLLGLQQQQQTATAELASLESGFSLRGSIFSSMLDSSTSTNNNKRLNQPALNNGDATAALIHGPDSKDDSAASASRPANLIAPNQRGGITGDYWAKFNEVLLKFLNDYSRQIEQDEERRLRAQRSSLAGPTTTAERNQQQQQRQQTSSRRSSSSSLDRSRASIEGGDPESTAASDANELDRGDQDHHHHRGDSGTAAPSDKRHEDYLQQQARKPAVVKRTSLLTFACMAQEGNPMANLTFDWYFGSVRLPQASQYQQLAMTDNIDNSLANEQRGQEAANNHAFASSANQQRQPNIIYSNENETLAIVLTRRLDSGTMLNPFQMSFLTVNVIVVVNGPNGNNLNDDDDELQSRSSSSSSDSNSNNNITTTPMKAPVIKSRYQSFYGSLQAANYEQQPISTSSLTGSRRRSNNNNIQFGQEFGNHQRNHQQNYPQHHQAEIEINEHNWQERLGQLLSCSVSNSVGPSEACHVRVSLPSKLGANSNGLAGSSSLYGFAKWRMPSLAQKSLLIISILIGCSLIVFATFALLIGPHLRAMQLIHQKRPGSGASSSMTTNKDDQGTMHTGQSTSSQKSSMMGLLGNGADSSFPSSSDDDTSGRLNQLESSVCATSGNKRQQANFGRHHGNMLEMDAAELSPDDRLIGSTGGDVGGGGQFDYDLPRSATANMALHRPPPGGRLVYQPDVGNFNFQKDSLDYENYQYQYGHHDTTNNNNNNNSTNQQQLKKSTGNHHSTSSRILASLKSKFKGQDRISDFQGGNRWSSSAVHNRNVSNSETATTGISVSGLDAHNESLSTTGSGGGNHHGPMRTNSNRGGAMLHNLGVPVNLRHSYAGTRVRAQRHPSTSYQPMTMAKASSYYAAPQDQTNGHSLDDATYNRLVQLNSQVFINGQQQQHQGPPLTNAMDEFMRRRGLDTSTAFDHDQDDDSTLVTNYGSQSIRNQSSTMYSLRNELTQLAHKLPAAGSRVLKPPIYPRASATTTATQQPPSNYQISAMFKPAPPPPPPIAARASQRDQLMFNRHSLSNSGSISHQHNLFPMGPSGVATPYCEPNIMQGQQPFAGSGLSANTANRFDTIDTHLNRLADNVALGYYNSSQEQQQQQQIAYANAVGVSHQYAQGNQYDANSSQANSTMANNSSVNHIYDLNAYATPEQTPLRRLQQQAENQNQSSSILESERLRVSQLIQTFNTKHPEHSSS